MFKRRSAKTELLDNALCSNDELKKNLDEMELINHYFGSKKLLITAFNKIHDKFPNYFRNNTITVGDLGCGNGDLLRAIDEWAKSRNLHVELIGIDINPFIIRYAIEKSLSHPDIQYKIDNILSTEFKHHKFDIICINSVCHHFDNATLVTLFKNLKEQTRLAIIINDLHRHWLSYYSIYLLSRLFRFSTLAKIDGPLSVLRAFRKNELLKLLKQAEIKNYLIRWMWAFRWQIIIWCS